MREDEAREIAGGGKENDIGPGSSQVIVVVVDEDVAVVVGRMVRVLLAGFANLLQVVSCIV